MHRIGINYTVKSGLTVEEAALLFRLCGFDTMFTEYFGSAKSMEPSANAARRNGLEYECIHGPFRHINDIWYDRMEGDMMLAELTNCVDAAAELGVPYVVTHLSSGEEAPCVSDCGHKRFDLLVEHAVKRGVTLAVENQRKIGNISFVMELYEKVPNVKFCWDTGHETCFTPGRSYLPLFGDKLVYTHIQDNTCEKGHDYHMIPFDGRIDFSDRIRQLKRVGYEGTLTLEIFPDVSPLYRGVSMDEYYMKAYKAACRLRNMMDMGTDA